MRYFILFLVTRNVSLAQTRKASSSSMPEVFASTRFALSNNVEQSNTMDDFLTTCFPSKYRPKMEPITVAPITHRRILLFSCTFCYTYMEFSLYQQQQCVVCFFTQIMKIFSDSLFHKKYSKLSKSKLRRLKHICFLRPR